jgi:hypothetical protein
MSDQYEDPVLAVCSAEGFLRRARSKVDIHNAGYDVQAAMALLELAKASIEAAMMGLEIHGETRTNAVT